MIVYHDRCKDCRWKCRKVCGNDEREFYSDAPPYFIRDYPGEPEPVSFVYSSPPQHDSSEGK